jgi:hypothetical protein
VPCEKVKKDAVEDWIGIYEYKIRLVISQKIPVPSILR